MRFPTLPALVASAWGGLMTLGAAAQQPTGVEPFTIAVPDAKLADLRERLARTRWPDQLPDTGWEYGADTAYMKELADYWQNGFDWRAQERRLNELDHYRADIDGRKIHFIHERSSDPDTIPILLLHGWPSSFVQMLDLIPRLTDPAAHGFDDAPSFHVVAASLPGYGFSDIPTEPGVGFATIADSMGKLMHDVLGYSRYGVRGSDLGGVIVRQMALTRPDEVIGVHLTGIIGSAGGQPPFTPAEQAFIDANQAIEMELAYARLHMSRPQTLAHALTDSPVGLAAWIVEKFRSWGDTGGDLESRFSKDDLLLNLTGPFLAKRGQSPFLPGRRKVAVDRRRDHKVAQTVARDRELLLHGIERAAHARKLVRTELLVQSQLPRDWNAQAPVARELGLEHREILRQALAGEEEVTS